MIDAKKLKKMMEDSRNGIPKDSKGQDITIGRVAKADVNIEPKKVVLDGKIFFLGPKLSRICGKVISVGSKTSLIQPCGESAKEVSNDSITIIA